MEERTQSRCQGLPIDIRSVSGMLPFFKVVRLIGHSVGVMVCRWLFQLVHDTNAGIVFDYILPLMVRYKLPDYWKALIRPHNIA